MMGSHFLVFNSIGNVPKIKVVFMLCYANDWSALLRLSSAVSSFKNRCNCTHTALRIYWDWIAQTASRGDHWCMWLHIQCSVNANCLHARAVESTSTLHNMHITLQVVCLRKRQCFESRFTGGDTKLHFLFLFFCSAVVPVSYRQKKKIKCVPGSNGVTLRHILMPSVICSLTLTQCGCSWSEKGIKHMWKGCSLTRLWATSRNNRA